MKDQDSKLIHLSNIFVYKKAVTQITEDLTFRARGIINEFVIEVIIFVLSVFILI